ncbi:bifunctional 3'-5' exonuclease/DNA polymerase [Glycomyces tritici]|uniref:DNA-directed DNA polymerase n=1 Tax=Glycomyces tritici TaxID=2665176 RepID=A0ABT7YVU0_9ACTN|nr:bifunctional 3'-5' exonuclease/DNA polymerase [Glycomyces tritici]MDN3242737.1 bifunctional 3'-5' exonuclease/DNA polymerase [Glycomyces tritici]
MEVALVHGRGGEGWTMPLPGGAVAYHPDLAAAVTAIEADARQSSNPSGGAREVGERAGTASGADGAGAGVAEKERVEDRHADPDPGGPGRPDFGHGHPDSPRWVLADAAHDYPPLLQAGARLDRCRDLRLAERILSRVEGREPPAVTAESDPDAGTLFEREPEPVDGPAILVRLQATWLDQRRRTAAADLPGLGTLLAAESAGALVAAEMSRTGVPFDRGVHDRLLRDLLGPRPTKGMRPRKLQALADKVIDAFGHQLNPDSTKQVLAAFHAAGLDVKNTHSWELASVDHPAVEALKVYREHARVWSAFGWNWADAWVSETGAPGAGADPAPADRGRFRPVYMVGGADTGRWGTDGGGALQLPHAVREAIRAEPGWKLVAADAAQLEPRLLAAISGDRAMIAATAADDLYTELAPRLGGERSKAKIALISAMYGGTAGDAAQLVQLMKDRFPAAFHRVESAARTGEKGGLVRTWLGRTVPAPGERWWQTLNSEDGIRAATGRGRFTRNFIVQGTAAEWALVLLALLRRELHERGLGELVFFLHDEVVVHCPATHADTVGAVIEQAAEAATRTLFGDMPVRIPLRPKVVDSYSEAK